MHYKLGRLPAKNTLHTMRYAIAMSRMLDPLGTPPDACNDYMAAVLKHSCYLYGNDEYGDCVAVDTAYGHIVRSANVIGHIIWPRTTNVLDLYSAVTGFDPKDPSTDNGTDEVSMCQYLKAHGFLGHKLDDFATIDPKNLDHVRWCIYLFGGLRVGLNLPACAEDQFDSNQPWDTKGDQTIAGGHDVRLCDYRGGLFYCSTWGRWRQPITPAFLSAFCDEAHPEIFYDWIKTQGVSPSGFNIADLEVKMKEAAG